jgi:hypothetical protein
MAGRGATSLTENPSYRIVTKERARGVGVGGSEGKEGPRYPTTTDVYYQSHLDRALYILAMLVNIKLSPS